MYTKTEIFNDIVSILKNDYAGSKTKRNITIPGVKLGRKLVHFSKNAVYTIRNKSIEYFPFNKWFTAAIEIEEGAVVGQKCPIN